MQVNKQAANRVNSLQLDAYAELWLAREMLMRLGKSVGPQKVCRLFSRRQVSPSVVRMVAMRHPLDFSVSGEGSDTLIELRRHA